MSQPEAQLLLVATPIGNLADISFRAVEALRQATVIFAEDTRHTLNLLRALDVADTARLRSLHEHNEAQRATEIVERVTRGELVVMVSDAGTPGISDPGERIVADCAKQGIAISMIPGANAATMAVVLSGLPATPHTFFGFLDRKGSARRSQLALIANHTMTSVVYESPKRIGATLDDLIACCGPDRPAAIARELTKLHEQVARGTLARLRAAVDAEAIPTRGEVVIVVAAAAAPARIDEQALIAEVDACLESGMRTREVADTLAQRHGVARREVYEIAVARARATR